MLADLIASVLPYLILALGAVGSLFLYGRRERKGGFKDASDSIKEEDREDAKAITDRVERGPSDVMHGKNTKRGFRD